MYSISFPDMVSGGRTGLYKDHEATASNLKLILLTCTKNTLFGDPFYGNNLLKTIFNQNSVLLQDIVREEIYTTILEYIPQLQVDREDIILNTKGTELFATIRAINLIDNTPDLYNIRLTDLSEL